MVYLAWILLPCRAWERDKIYSTNKAKGAAGIDGQSLRDYAKELDNNLTQRQHELQTNQYRPLAVKRTERSSIV